MARHLMIGELKLTLQRRLFYLKRWARMTYARWYRSRHGSYYRTQQYTAYRRPARPRFRMRFSRRLLSQLYLAVALVVLGVVIATHPLQTGELVTRTFQGGWGVATSGVNWVRNQLYPGLVFTFRADLDMPVKILEAGLPQVTQGEPEQLDLVSLTKKLVSTVTSVNLDQVESILEAQFLGADFEFPAYMTERAPDPALLPVETKPQVETAKNSSYGQQPLVAIYHTHSSETYHGRNEHLKGEQFFAGDYCWGETDGVISVGDQVAAILSQEYKIPVVHSRKIHDYPVFRNAYTNSKLTLENILREYPSIKVVLDLHRDGLTRPPEEEIKTVVAGENLARVAIIVGKGQKGYENPHWQQNQAFAQKLHQAMESLYPGLSRGIIMKDWPYNQELHPQALLLEVGDHYNTKEEALRSAQLVADALAMVIQGG